MPELNKLTERSCHCIQVGRGLNPMEILYEIVYKKYPREKDYCIHFQLSGDRGFCHIIEACKYYVADSVNFQKKSIECKC